MGRSIEAVAFDFDGLIVDTETPEYESWRSVYRAYGADLPLWTWLPHVGRGRDSFDVYDHLAQVAGRPIDREEARRMKRAAFDGMFADAAPLPGVEDYIAAARARGMGLGIASSSTRAWVEPKLDLLGLADAFDTVICADDVGSSKPNPASYLAVIANLGVTAEQAVALEDSPNGVQGAKNAGLLCVAVPGPMTRGESFDHADLILHALTDLSLDDLLEALP